MVRVGLALVVMSLFGLAGAVAAAATPVSAAPATDGHGHPTLMTYFGQAEALPDYRYAQPRLGWPPVSLDRAEQAACRRHPGCQIVQTQLAWKDAPGVDDDGRLYWLISLQGGGPSVSRSRTTCEVVSLDVVAVDAATDAVYSESWESRCP